MKRNNNNNNNNNHSRVFQETNKAVIHKLKEGLWKEKKELSEKQHKEKLLRSKVKLEEKLIREKNLVEKRKRIIERLNEYYQLLRKNKVQLRQKEQLLKETEQALAQEQQKMAAEQKQKSRLIQALELKIEPQLRRDLAELPLIKKKDEELRRRIALENQEKSSIELQLNALRQAVVTLPLDQSLISFDLPEDLSDLLNPDIIVLKQYEQCFKGLEGAEARENNQLKQEIYIIKQEMRKLKLKKAELIEKVERRNNSLRDLDSLKLKRTEVGKLLTSQAQKLEALLEILEHRKKGQKYTSQKIKKDLLTIKEQKERQRALHEEAKKELKKLRNSYEQKIDEADQNKKLLDEKIKQLEEKKSLVWNDLEDDKLGLEGIKNDLLQLEKKLQEKELYSFQEKSLAQELSSLQREKHLEEEELTKIESLIKKVQQLSLIEPDKVLDFQKKKENLQEKLHQQEKEISQKENTLHNLHTSLSQLKLELQQKQGKITELQKNMLGRQRKHQEMLSRLNDSLIGLQAELVRIAHTEKNIESKKEILILNKKGLLQKGIGKINEKMIAQQKEYQEHCSLFQQQQNKLGKLEESRHHLLKSIAKNRGIWKDYDHNIDVEKEKRQSLTAEQRLLQKVIGKIAKEEEILQDRIANKSKVAQTIEQDKGKVKKELAKYLLKLKRKAMLQGKRKLSRMDNLISKHRRNYQHLDHQIKQEKRRIAEEISLDKSGIIQQSMLTKDIRLLRKRRKKNMEKLGPLQETITKISQAIPHWEAKVESAEVEEKKIDHKLSMHQQRLHDLEHITKERLVGMNEKLLLKQELKLLRATVKGKAERFMVKRKGLGGAITGKDSRSLRVVLKKIDTLLGKLPEKEISTFAKSSDFYKYKKVMESYGVK